MFVEEVAQIGPGVGSGEDQQASAMQVGAEVVEPQAEGDGAGVLIDGEHRLMRGQLLEEQFDFGSLPETAEQDVARSRFEGVHQRRSADGGHGGAAQPAPATSLVGPGIGGGTVPTRGELDAGGGVLGSQAVCRAGAELGQGGDVRLQNSGIGFLDDGFAHIWFTRW